MAFLKDDYEDRFMAGFEKSDFAGQVRRAVAGLQKQGQLDRDTQWKTLRAVQVLLRRVQVLEKRAGVGVAPKSALESDPMWRRARAALAASHPGRSRAGLS